MRLLEKIATPKAFSMGVANNCGSPLCKLIRTKLVRHGHDFARCCKFKPLACEVGFVREGFRICRAREDCSIARRTDFGEYFLLQSFSSCGHDKGACFKLELNKACVKSKTARDRGSRSKIESLYG